MKYRIIASHNITQKTIYSKYDPQIDELVWLDEGEKTIRYFRKDEAHTFDRDEAQRLKGMTDYVVRNFSCWLNDVRLEVAE